MKRTRVTLFLNILIVILTAVGVTVMFAINAPKGALSSFGFANFKYYTVLANVICGAAAALYLAKGRGRRPAPEWLAVLKLMAAAAVTLTFLTIALFLGPIWGHAMMYRGSNLFFHLFIPIVAIADFILWDTGDKIPLKAVFLSALFTIVYGVCYAVNLFANGIGQWPDTNDWYGFVTWGYPVGFAIFGMITLATIGAALLLRGLNMAVRKRR